MRSAVMLRPSSTVQNMVVTAGIRKKDHSSPGRSDPSRGVGMAPGVRRVGQVTPHWWWADFTDPLKATSASG